MAECAAWALAELRAILTDPKGMKGFNSGCLLNGKRFTGIEDPIKFVESLSNDEDKLIDVLNIVISYVDVSETFATKGVLTEYKKYLMSRRISYRNLLEASEFLMKSQEAKPPVIIPEIKCKDLPKSVDPWEANISEFHKWFSQAGNIAKILEIWKACNLPYLNYAVVQNMLGSDSYAGYYSHNPEQRRILLLIMQEAKLFPETIKYPHISDPFSDKIKKHLKGSEAVKIKIPQIKEEILEEGDCPVCLERKAIIGLHCGHLFCSHCLYDHVETYNKDFCPTCKEKIKGVTRYFR